MDIIKVIPAIIVMHLLLGCGDSTNANDNHTPEYTVMDATCGPWLEDVGFHALSIEKTLDATTLPLLVSVSSASNGGIAIFNEEQWEIKPLPADITSVPRMSSSDSGDVYVSAVTSDGSLTLLSGIKFNTYDSAMSWKTVYHPELTNIKHLYHDNDILLILGLDARGTQSIMSLEHDRWITNTLPLETRGVRLDKFWSSSKSFFVYGTKSDNGNNESVIFYRSIKSPRWHYYQTPAAIGEFRDVTVNDHDELMIAGQSIDGHGVIYHVSADLLVWSIVISSDAIDTYTSIYAPSPENFTAIGYSNMIADGHEGKTGTLWATYGQNGTMDTHSIAQASPLPKKIWYDASRLKYYLLTDKNLYTRSCQ